MTPIGAAARTTRESKRRSRSAIGATAGRIHRAGTSRNGGHRRRAQATMRSCRRLSIAALRPPGIARGYALASLNGDDATPRPRTHASADRAAPARPPLPPGRSGPLARRRAARLASLRQRRCSSSLRSGARTRRCRGHAPDTTGPAKWRFCSSSDTSTADRTARTLAPRPWQERPRIRAYRPLRHAGSSNPVFSSRPRRERRLEVRTHRRRRRGRTPP
jgi:hypothetical protein